MFLRVAAVALGALAFSAAGSGGTAAFTATAAGTRPQAGSGSIAGTVTHESDNAPLPRTRVIARSPALPHPRVALVDTKGTFLIDSLPPGDYELRAVRTGYVTPHAANGPDGGPAVRLGAGETRTGVAIRLQRAATIPGRLLDEDGTPLARATIEALSLRTDHGQPPRPTASVTTDDRGEFRLSGLPAGQYFVAARDPAFADVGDASGVVRYAPTYHPGVLALAEAQPIAVGPGEEAARVEFRLRLVRPSRVAGRITTPDGKPLASGTVLLSSKNGVATPLSAGDIDLRPDGRFVLRNLPPGVHQLRVRAEIGAGQPMWFGTFSVTAQGYDIDQIPVVLEPGTTIRGRVEFPVKSPPARTLRVRAPLADGTSFADALTGTVERNSTFHINGVMPGPHYFAVEGLPEGWAISDIFLHGRSVIDREIDVAAGESIDDLRIIVSPAAATLHGTVRDERGQPAVDALVVTTPSLPSRPSTASPRFRTTRTDGEGRYRLAGLASGAYRVTAVRGIDELLVRRPEWLARVAANSSPIDVGDARSHTLDLRLVDARALAGSAAAR
jgi:hypothetical protein